MKRWLHSFRCAAAGLAHLLRTQANARIHAVATALVLLTGFFLHLEARDWCWLVLAIAMVWTAEALNTAIECLADHASSGPHPLIGHAKDVAAGAVLCAAAGSAVIGLLVLGPGLRQFLAK